MTAAKPTSEEVVVRALASQGELTNAEIVTTTGLARSTVAKTLAALERARMAHRTPGGREGGRRLPDRWSVDSTDTSSPSSGRLRPGQLDELVLDLLNTHHNDAPTGPTAVAKALGRSTGAVGNCLARLAAAGHVRQVSQRPRRYSAIERSGTRGRTRRPRKEHS
ncbi:MAG TPA: helix-turn-helix domain-containing protein [Solirubrobacteraceae bacterium]